MKLQDAIQSLIKQSPLTECECTLAAQEIAGSADPIQTAVFIALLRSKGETVEEITAFARAFRQLGKPLSVGRSFVDLVGTGGDRAGTINISTASALLTAACGAPVVKHGNRAVSSRSGAADVLEAMGFDLHGDPKESLAKTNFAFCYAPDYYPMLKLVKPARDALKLPTIFNLIGPLLNPAGLDHVLLGVFDPLYVEPMAEALQRLGTKRSLVFSGCGIDELSCLGKTTALLVTPEAIEPFEIDPEQLGLQTCTLEDLRGQDAAYNARAIRRALSGKQTTFSDTLVLNAAAALFIYGPARTLEEGVSLARETLSKGVL